MSSKSSSTTIKVSDASACASSATKSSACASEESFEQRIKEHPYLEIDTNDPLDANDPSEIFRRESEEYTKDQAKKKQIIHEARKGVEEAMKKGGSGRKILSEKRKELQQLYNKRGIRISKWAWDTMVEYDSELGSDDYNSDVDF